MYILSYTANSPEIVEYHDKPYSLMTDSRATMRQWYIKRKHNPIYKDMKVVHYWNGTYTDVTNDIGKDVA